MPLGCDTATKLTRGTLRTLVNEKYTFVGRYLNALTPEERTCISSSGLFIVSLYERGSPTHIGYFTAAQGITDAASAIQKARALGQPVNTPIYFTVDYNASPSNIEGGITQYLQAVKHVFDKEKNPYELGLYGSGAVLSYFKNTYPYTWLAAATAWSGSKDYSGWSIKQNRTNQTVGVGDGRITIDTDESNGAAGGWRC